MLSKMILASEQWVICKCCYVLIIALYLELLLWCFKYCSLVCPSVISALRRFWPSRPCCRWTTPSSTAPRTNWFMPTTLEWTLWYQEEITWCCSMYIHRCVPSEILLKAANSLRLCIFLQPGLWFVVVRTDLLLSEYSSHLSWLPYGRFAAVGLLNRLCRSRADVCVYM